MEDPSPTRIAFDLKRPVRTRHVIDDFRQACFVIDSFEALPEACCRDFGTSMPSRGTSRISRRMKWGLKTV
jgi:phenylalanine-4-hydroxylase